MTASNSTPLAWHHRAILTVFLLLIAYAGFHFWTLQPGSVEYAVLSPGELRGMSAVREGVPYTLNFQQQTTILRLLNESTLSRAPKQLESFPVSFVRIHGFEEKELDMVILGVERETLWVRLLQEERRLEGGEELLNLLETATQER